MTNIRIVYHVENVDNGEPVADGKTEIDLSQAELTQAQIETLARMEHGPNSEAADAMRAAKREGVFEALGLHIGATIDDALAKQNSQ